MATAHGHSLPLHRVRLPPKVHAMLNARGIQTASQLLVMTEVELREKLDVSVRGAARAREREICMYEWYARHVGAVRD